MILSLVFIVSHTSLSHSDASIVADGFQSLNSADGNKWTAMNANSSISITGSVPGEIHGDLITSKIIGDPFYRFRDVDYRWIAWDDWTYTVEFEKSKDLGSGLTWLVFDGIQTAATVVLNGKTCGFANNQFRRWIYPVDLQSKNTLVVNFTSSVIYAREQSHNYTLKPVPSGAAFLNGFQNRQYVRLEQSSFGWDWGPAFAPQGLWKDVYIVSVSDVAITYVTPHTFVCSRGTTTTPLKDGDNCFDVRVDVWISAEKSETCGVSVSGEWGAQNSTSFAVSEGEQMVTVWVKAQNVKLWWPNGYGDQNLYNLEVSVDCNQYMNNMKKRSTTIGFRSVELIRQYNGNNAMFFRINGVQIFSKGANWIPADAFESRSTPEVVLDLLESAVNANMNMVRVWGGGIYQSEDFYATCDKLGLMVWQEMIFACSEYPVDQPFLDNVREEIKHQLRRLSTHPSIVMWSGNNEDGGKERGPRSPYHILNYDVIMDQVCREDTSRPIMQSSPSSMFTQGVTDSGLPSGTRENPMPLVIGGSDYSHDAHHYNYNKCTQLDSFPNDANFASEFGFQSLPSFETIQPVTKEEDWFLFSPWMNARQHHPKGNHEIQMLLQNNFRTPDFNNNSLPIFQRIIYLTQVLQSLCIRTETEFYRRARYYKQNVMGTLYWQLNQNWQAPSWTSLEYGGRWKIFHYQTREMYSPTLISSHTDTDGIGLQNNYFVKVLTDSASPVTGTAKLDIIKWADGSMKTITFDFHADAMQSFDWNTTSDELKATGECTNATDCFVRLTASDNSGKLVAPVNYYWMSHLKDVDLQPANITTKVISYGQATGTVTVELSSNVVAPWVTLWSPTNGIWSDNVLVLLPNEPVQTTFHSKETLPSQSDFERLMRVDYLNAFWTAEKKKKKKKKKK